MAQAQNISTYSRMGFGAEPFHLLLEEIQTGGMSKFMQQLCGSMSANFNAKYKEKGSLFQGAYKGIVVDTDAYLRQLIPYIMVKNVLKFTQVDIRRH